MRLASEGTGRGHGLWGLLNDLNCGSQTSFLTARALEGERVYSQAGRPLRLV